MLNEPQTQTPMLSEAQVRTLIDERLKDWLRRDEFEQRLSALKNEARSDAEKILHAGLVDAEMRLNANVRALLDGFNAFKEGFATWKLASDERIGNWSGLIRKVDVKQSEQERVLNGLQVEHTRIVSEVKALTVTIHGDVTQRDGAPSIYETMNLLNRTLGELKQRFDEQTKAEAARREQHERRWRVVHSIGNWIARNPVITAILTLALVGLLSVLWPQLAALLKAFLHIP